jgi:hypothetical protein
MQLTCLILFLTCQVGSARILLLKEKAPAGTGAVWNYFEESKEAYHLWKGAARARASKGWHGSVAGPPLQERIYSGVH